jgi:uncharacterized protein YceH (UPF0502 family)
MALTSEEARVLASLMEAEAIAPDRYPLTVNELRLACNQTSGRDPVVAYDDRTVESSLLSLTSKGLVRAAQAPGAGAELRYRHTADDRWHLGADELVVLAALVLGGAQRATDVRRRLDHQFLGNRPIRVDDILDTLAARSPEPFAGRQPRRAGDGEPTWAHRLSGEPPPLEVADTTTPLPRPQLHPAEELRDQVDRLTGEMSELRDRVAQLEKLLGPTPDDVDAGN